MSDHAVLPLPAPARLQVERLTQEAYAPFGWVIGDPPASGVIEGPSALFFHARRYRARWQHLEEVAQIDDHIFYAIRR